MPLRDADPAPPSAADWADDAAVPPPQPAPASAQLPLFVFDDAPGPRESRLRRLKRLVAAMEPPHPRTAPGDADRASTRQPPASSWPDSFFD